MREILFRGKRVDNGEWVEGYYVAYRVTGGGVLYHHIKNSNNTYQIHPESVGQFSGLLDKNRKKIFEGDLVKVPDDWDEYGFMAGEIREIYFFFGGFRLMPKEGKSYGHYIEDTGVFEIIGNIHDSTNNLPPH